MLRFLGVRHLAVIEQVEVDFEPGLNVLTGETGAGKSVLIAAIDLLVGGRASADLVRTGESSASVQAVFDRGDGQEVLVRREIAAQGRSRAFIDGALATSAALRTLGRQLAELHGQHEHHGLLDAAAHIGHLDAFAAEPGLLDETAAAFEAWRAAAGALDRSQLDDREKRLRIEMAEFQLQDIDAVAPTAGEDARLEQERGVLGNADRLARLSHEAYGALYEGDGAALPSLAGVWKRVADLAAIDDRFTGFLEARDAVTTSLEDLAFFLRSYASDIEASPDRLEFVEARLAVIDRLKKRYGPSLDQVLARRQALDEELAALGAGEARAAELEKRERDTRTAFLAAADRLSRVRAQAAGRLTAALEAALADLAMPACRVEVRTSRLERPTDWSPRGIDEVEFYLSPNPGEELRPLARIASGGELSRIMLALHTLAAVGVPGRTLVFDEVDAGIGGAAADAVGARLQALARRYQVVCITHLPQIAARADAHFVLTKTVRDGRTTTSAARLDPRGREDEIARMIAGLRVTDRVRSSARELLQAGQAKRESKTKGESESVRRAKAKPRR